MSAMKPGTALFVMVPLVAVVAAFLFVAQRGAGAGPLADGVYWNEQIARFLRRRVADTYVDELGEERAAFAFYRAMDAYVHALDEYSDFIPPEEHRRWRETTTGRYAGLGIKISPVPEGLEIVGLLPGAPASRAGLKAGDVVVSADGTSLAGVGTERVEAQRLLKGEKGSPVTIGILQGPRPPSEGPPWGPPKLFRILRAVIRPPDVYARRVGAKGEYGVIRLAEFTEGTEGDFSSALEGLLEAGVKAVVLDLRGNGGGVLPTAVAVADRFVDKGVIVRMEGRTPRANRVYEARSENTVSDTLPLVVLVNGRSASASEVVAGALQDHRRALLVGERTYGKFLVQQITDVPDQEVALQLTTSRYYLPSGRSYQRSHWNDGGRNGRRTTERDTSPAGILPDIVVPLDDEQHERIAKFQRNEEAVPWGEAKPFPEVADDWVDPQLARALELLEGQLVLRRIRGTPR